MVKKIPLTQGKYALVDDDDFEELSCIKWYFMPSGTGYAAGRVRKSGKVVRVLMHRIVIKAPPGMSVDHINGDGLDNRRSNLRLATQSENMRNRRPPKGFKGVHFRKERGVYHAYITVDGKRKNLGHFTSAVAAACAYDYAATLYFGEFSRLNFPNDCPLSPDDVESKRYERKGSSRFRGVGLFKWGSREKRWRAKIMVNYETISLGYFDSEIEAARAYNEAAIKYRGSNTKLNEV